MSSRSDVLRTAVVFGGSGGIGAGVVARVATRQPVVFTYHSHAERAEKVVAEHSNGPHQVQIVSCDATTEKDVVATFDVAGDVDTVVFCVGGWSYPRLADLEIDAMDAELALNLRSALLVLRESARRVADGGRIVLLSSAAASVAPARQAVYVAAKAGLEGAARVAAKELASRRVTVNVVRPGSTDTETLRDGTSTRAIEAMAGANAMRRLGTVDDVAGAVDLLLSRDAGWITGSIIDATGGLY